MVETKVTSKYQTTIPKDIRKLLKVRSGGDVEWYVIKSMVVVDSVKKIKNPVRFLTSQTSLTLDAVELVRKSREDFR